MYFTHALPKSLTFREIRHVDTMDERVENPVKVISYSTERSPTVIGVI